MNLENEIVNMVSIFVEYFVRTTLQLDVPGITLSSDDFDNITAVLLLIEELVSEATNDQQEEIKHAICEISDIAKAASVLLEHMNDEGTYMCD